MDERIADLTDKEKEALRLLLGGHDAKSSAAELDISVHTVNDRLRNARRKMGVSSSREAARILGDTEGATPQNPVHTSFGITPTGEGTNTADLNHKGPARRFGITWLAGGMLIMSILIAAAIVGVFYTADDGNNSGAANLAADTGSSENVSVEAAASLDRARVFIQFTDAGDWKGSWEAAGPYFQSETTVEKWAEVVEPVRAHLGEVKERRVASVQRTSSLPGAPEGEYEVVQFHTVFSEVEGIAVETLIMLKGEHGWEVAGYFVRPALN